MVCPISPQIYCFPSSIRSTSYFCPPFFSTLFTFAIIWQGISILFIIPWHDYPSTQWAVETKSVRWESGVWTPLPHPLFPLLCSQWNWPDSAQDMAPAFFNQERNCWHVDTFLSKFWRWIRGRWGFLTLCIVPFSHHSYIVGCPTRPGEPACSRAANHPFLSEQAFRSGRREGQELGSVIRVCSLLTALLTHLRKDQKISTHCSTFRIMKCQTHPPSSPYSGLIQQ